MAIHASAVVDPKARIHPTAEVGPFSIIGPEVTIGAGTRLLGHAFVEGPIDIGEDNVFYPYSTIGVAPQDLKYNGEASRAKIGNRNKIREFVTIHRGTEGGGMLTQIGDDNLLQAYTHVAHDTRIGNHVILGHGATLGGHVTIEDWAVVSAGSAVHQFCRVGKHCIIGGYSVITQDVLPYSTTVSPRDVKVFGANATGLERRGFAAATIEHLHKAFRLLTRSQLNTTQAIEKIRAEIPACPEVEDLLEFIASSERGVIK